MGIFFCNVQFALKGYRQFALKGLGFSRAAKRRMGCGFSRCDLPFAPRASQRTCKYIASGRDPQRAPS